MLEGPSPASLAREGWSNKSLKPGDQLKMTIWPSRENKAGGVFYPRYTTFRDGKAIGDETKARPALLRLLDIVE